MLWISRVEITFGHLISAWGRNFTSLCWSISLLVTYVGFPMSMSLEERDTYFASAFTAKRWPWTATGSWVWELLHQNANPAGCRWAEVRSRDGLGQPRLFCDSDSGQPSSRAGALTCGTQVLLCCHAETPWPKQCVKRGVYLAHGSWGTKVPRSGEAWQRVAQE